MEKSMSGTVLLAIAASKSFKFDEKEILGVLEYWQKEECLSVENLDICKSIIAFIIKAKTAQE